MVIARLCLSLQLRWRHWEYRHMACSDLSNIQANLVLVILLALLVDCSHQKVWFIYSTVRYWDWSALVNFALIAEFVYIVLFFPEFFSAAFCLLTKFMV